MTPRPCVYCGRKVFDATTASGNPIVLDAYALVFQLKDSHVLPVATLADHETFVVHSAVCRPSGATP